MKNAVSIWLRYGLSTVLAIAAWSDAALAQEPSAAEEETDDEPKWDVANPPGDREMVEFTTTSGTWMSLDVSPDGTELVFDLLGDIYTVPIGGGPAQALTAGIPWDMQPTYSPDGQTIAFTSDRGGGDNIWLMNRDGGEAKALTTETFRLLNSPAWTPDGQYVAARKHFTSKRSLGTGEIWLYHVLGGSGVQMTKRPNEQKDVGEPAFSPDGRYLYFSQDVTPGRRFEYSKDPNGTIYAINRLDRETGDVVERYVSRPGGSIRPTPSPDGKYLAFVRRVRYQSTLFLRELESGIEWPIYGGLDRDMQETWATHGVYPAMDWTPDSQSIVFWAGGIINRIDVASREVSPIPIEVEVSRAVAPAIRYPVEVAPERFKTKMLRWVAVSPDGTRVAFQTLGCIYVRDLKGGKAKRLTRQTDHYEMYPALSRDSRRMVYTTWNDERLGAVRLVSARGGRSRVLTQKPGHFVEPAFSPDGKTVIYRKIGSGPLRTKAWAHDRGIYSVPSGGGEARLVCEQGAAPHFGEGSGRVFLLDVDSGELEDSRRLISIELDGSDERRHFVSKNATAYRVSPNGDYVAFQERFHVFVVPFTLSGREIEIGPKGKSLPIKKVTENAGDFLHWAGDSQSLHWSLGPTLFTQALESIFQAKKQDDEEDETDETKPVETALGFETAADKPNGTVALVGARLVTMATPPVIEDGVIVIEENRIAAIGRRGAVSIPEGALEIDVAGHTIVPGMIDVHAHGPMGSAGIIPQRNWSQYANLAFGVTTIHDPSNDTHTVFAASEMARAGLIVAPRIFSTGTILYGAAGTQRAEVDSLEDARTHLLRMKAVGAFSVKSYNQPRRDQRQQILAAARELKMMVVPEGGSLYHHNMTMIVDGHTGIEHTVPVARLYSDALGLWSATKTGYTPTLVVAYGGTSGENYWYQKFNVWEHRRLMTFVPRDVVDPLARRRVMAPEEEYNHIAIAQGAKALIDAGGKVQLGAHGQLAGLGAHWELWMLAQGGMTPHEALRAATLDGAFYLGLDGDIGSLEPGKLADLLVLERNPLEDIRNSEHIRYTILNGRIFDARTMHETGNRPKLRGPFYWEYDYRN